MDLLDACREEMGRHSRAVSQSNRPEQLLGHFIDTLNNEFPSDYEKVFCADHFTRDAYTVVKGPVFFGKNVHIGPFCLLVGPLFIGDDVHIGGYNDICRSIILSGSKIHHQHAIRDSIVGRNAYLSSSVRIANSLLEHDERPIKVWYDHTCTQHKGKFGATIGHGAKLGTPLWVMPGAAIPENATIYGPSVVYGDGSIKSLMKG